MALLNLRLSPSFTFTVFKYTIKPVNARFKGSLFDDINLVKMITLKYMI